MNSANSTLSLMDELLEMMDKYGPGIYKSYFKDQIYLNEDDFADFFGIDRLEKTNRVPSYENMGKLSKIMSNFKDIAPIQQYVAISSLLLEAGKLEKFRNTSSKSAYSVGRIIWKSFVNYLEKQSILHLLQFKDETEISVYLQLLNQISYEFDQNSRNLSSSSTFNHRLYEYIVPSGDLLKSLGFVVEKLKNIDISSINMKLNSGYSNNRSEIVIGWIYGIDFKDLFKKEYENKFDLALRLFNVLLYCQTEALGLTNLSFESQFSILKGFSPS